MNMYFSTIQTVKVMAQSNTKLRNEKTSCEDKLQQALARVKELEQENADMKEANQILKENQLRSFVNMSGTVGIDGNLMGERMKFPTEQSGKLSALASVKSVESVEVESQPPDDKEKLIKQNEYFREKL